MIIRLALGLVAAVICYYLISPKRAVSSGTLRRALFTLLSPFRSVAPGSLVRFFYFAPLPAGFDSALPVLLVLQAQRVVKSSCRSFKLPCPALIHPTCCSFREIF
jgi:hypothetical protein